MRKAYARGLPPIDETIHQTITGHLRGHPREKQLIGSWKENPHWRDGCRWLKVMIGSLGFDATFPPRAKGPTFTVALASIEIRNMSEAASASSFRSFAWAKMASVAGSFLGVWLLVTFFGEYPAH